MPSVFISYNHKDKPFAKKLASSLSEYGIKVWIDEGELTIGDSLTQRIPKAIKENDYVAAILSSNSISSSWVQKELAIAMSHEIDGRRIKVLPILLEECDVPEIIKDKLYADFTDFKNYDSSFTKLLHTITNKIPIIISSNSEEEPEDLNTALLNAAWKDDIEIVKMLLDKGADPNVRNNFGETPLYIATSKGYTSNIMLLLDKGTDINTKNNWGVTPLYLAIYKGHSSAVQVLLERGADVNARDNDGKTPLMEAVEKGYTDIVKALLSKGADVNIESEFGLTAKKIAKKRGRSEIVELLKQHDATE